MATPDPKNPQGLNEWNAERAEYWALVRRRITEPQAVWNGLYCPACAGKLYDTGRTDGGRPARMRVGCQACSFTGERLE